MKRQLARVKKKKHVKPDALTTALINAKYWGEKPPPISKGMGQMARARFYAWCNYMVPIQDAREWLEAYLKPLGKTAKRVPDKWMNPTVCYRAKLKLEGIDFSEYQDKIFEEHLAQVMKHESEEEEEGVEKPSVRDRAREKYSEIMGELEGMIDDGLDASFDIVQWYREKELSPTGCRYVLNKLRPYLAQLDEALEGNDPQLAEAYRFMTKKGLQVHRDFYHQLIEKTQRLIDNEKKARAPRKPKPISVEKKLKFLNESYLKFSKDFNVNSIDPAKIIGAQELWTLNVKYKILTVFRAQSHGGQLDVARCKITGFDKNNSQSYRLGRKAESIIDQVIKSSKAGLKKITSDLKTANLQERINEHTILLRI